MIIIIGNQKGGAGKSTLTMLLANYLSRERNARVTVIDMDYQQSIAQKFEKAKILENEEPYQVIAAGLEQFPQMAVTIKRNRDHFVLIDLPGKLDDDGLIPVFKAADQVICPFSYDEFSYDSTILFSIVLRKINPNITIYYIPNRIKANVKYETQADVNEQLVKFGKVSLPLPDRIDFSRTNTLFTPLPVKPLVTQLFDQLFMDQNFNQAYGRN
jgi:chromosome partitioning protein